MSELQIWLLITVVSVIAVKLDPKEAIEIGVVTQGVLFYDIWKRKREGK